MSKKSKTKQANMTSTVKTHSSANVDDLINMFGHVTQSGVMLSKINWEDCDRDALGGIERVFGNALEVAIRSNDLPAFQKCYQAMRCILRLDMTDYMKFTVDFGGPGESRVMSPSEYCLMFGSWPIVMEIFKQGLDPTEQMEKFHNDSSMHILFRVGGWLNNFAGRDFYPQIESLAEEMVLHLLKTVEPILASGMTLKDFCQGFEKFIPHQAMKQIFDTQFALFTASPTAQ